MKRSAGGSDGHLAQPGMEPETLALGRRPRSPGGEESIRGPVDPGEQLGRRLERSYLDRGEPVRVRGGPPERHGLTLARGDALQLGRPVPDHLGQMGQDLGRSPGRLGGVVEAVGERPWRARLDGGSEAVEALEGGADPIRDLVGRHGESVACRA